MRKGSRSLVRWPALFRGALPSLLASTATLLPTGCGFDPNHDYGVTSTWLLNGSPPDAERCEELGIDTFRLSMDGPGPATKLEADCEETIRIGELLYGGFETSVSFDYGVDYDYTVDALDANGKVAFRYESTITAYYGDFVPVDLDTVDVFAPEGKTASFVAQWLYTDGDLAADCQRNQVDKVAIWLSSATDPDLFEPVVIGEAPCADGIIESDGKVLARGDYYFQYVSFTDRNAVAELGEPIPVSITGPQEVVLPRYQFEGL